MTALFRCDATADIGFGHLGRCIALAEAFRLLAVGSRFAGLFDPAAREQIERSGFEHVDLPEPVNGSRREPELRAGAQFIVVDSYRADERYVANLNAGGAAVVLIDDFNALGAYPCDVVLNFTWGARSLGYPEGPALLLGPEYFPARRRLVERRPQSLERMRGAAAANVLVAIGGADPKRIAARVAKVLSKNHGAICLRVLAANDDDPAKTVARFAPGSAVLPRQHDLSEQLLWADACITGGGLIKYEAAFMGVPAAAIAQNAGQDGETQALARAGLVFDLGLADDRSDEQLGGALGRFLSDATLRESLGARIRESFPADPSAHAARAILDAVRR